MVVLSLLLTGDRWGTVESAPALETSVSLDTLLAEANVLYLSGNVLGAKGIYSEGLLATPSTHPRYRSRFLTGLGNCDVLLHQYVTALRSYNDALKLASTHNFEDITLKAGVGRVSVYRMIADLPSARHAMAELEPLVLKAKDPSGLGQLASLARDIDFERSVRLYREAISLASLLGNSSLEAILWSQLGFTYLLKGDASPADEALTEAFRLKSFQSKTKRIQTEVFYIGWVRRLQGRYDESLSFLKRAKNLSSEPGSIPEFIVERELAKSYRAAGHWVLALQAYEQAVQTVEELRLQMLPSETFRLSSEESLQQVFSDYIDAGMESFEHTGDKEMAIKMFTVAEASRSALFRSSVASTGSLPPLYVDTLAKFRRVLGRSLKDPDPETKRELQNVRLDLANQESELGIGATRTSQEISETGGAGSPLSNLQTNLRSSEALLSFHLAAGGSFVWAVTREAVEVHRLPAKNVVDQHMSSYRMALETKAGDLSKHAEALSKDLFSGLSATVHAQPDWIFSLDGQLFNVPLASLPVSGGSDSGQPLGGAHSLRQMPGALWRGQEPVSMQEQDVAGGRFVGFADPIYNGADPRWKIRPASFEAELPRLPGSAREMNRCARSWNGRTSPIQVTGAAVRREALMAQLEQHPSVLHFGTHVLPHPVAQDQVMIALGLKPTGEADYLTPAEISRFRRPVGLVTLSGCSSGSGKAYGGLGLFGLSRAWLVSGASTVVASYWPIPDDDGTLLSAMYEELNRAGGHVRPRDVAQALRKAQSRMRQLSDWRANPSYWAAFFVVGKE
ncbi:MAG: CHAT domain-containing protein [Bryobacteraceae bacterium]|nr:CHAT domain-containing protein [Bryobacteraceae bacterium]